MYNTILEITEQYKEDGIKLLAKAGYELGEYNPHGMSAWLIHEPTAGTAVSIGGDEQEALDNLCDETNYFDVLAQDPSDINAQGTSLGNDGALYDIDEISMTKIIQA